MAPPAPLPPTRDHVGADGDVSAKRYSYDYPRPALTVDCVIFGLDADGAAPKVLLIERGREPFKGRWALPGGFVEMEETLEAAAARELAEETGVSGVALTQLHTFGAPGRDPRGRVVSVVYYGWTKTSEHAARAATDAAKVEWFAVDRTPPLAFDHDEILKLALQRLRNERR